MALYVETAGVSVSTYNYSDDLIIDRAGVSVAALDPYGDLVVNRAGVNVAVPDRESNFINEDSSMIYTDVIFPECITYGSTGVPRYVTDKIEVASGAEQRNQRWVYPKHKYNVVLENAPASDVANVMNIWHVCAGSYIGFLFLDPMDHTSRNIDGVVLSGEDVTPLDQFVAVAVGNQSQYPLYKYYRHGVRERRRRILYPKEGTLQVAIDGFECANWTYSYADNLITFLQPYNLTQSRSRTAGGVITGGSIAGLQVGDLVYVSGWSNNAYNAVEGGDPQRVRAIDGSSIVLENYNGSSLGTAVLGPENVNIRSALPPAGAEITAGYYFYVPVRFETDEDAESEITAGLRDSVTATFGNVVLVEVFE
jgi:uncharacterized protein (TIGR02217 family)